MNVQRILIALCGNENDNVHFNKMFCFLEKFDLISVEWAQQWLMVRMFEVHDWRNYIALIKWK